MYFSIPVYANNFYRPTNIPPKSYKTLEYALLLVKKSVQTEKEDEIFYDFLIKEAPTQEEKKIISSIRDDEIKHNQYFSEIYKFYTGESISSPVISMLEMPKSYITGVKWAKFDELRTVEEYRDIRAGLPDEYYRDMVFEILTDELKHAHKYDYILYLSLVTRNTSTSSPKTEFTAVESMEAAKILGIDFSKERFDFQQFIMGLNTELEHGTICSQTNITDDDLLLTAKIALAHLNEFPDYYTRLSIIEQGAKAYWSTK